MLARRQPDTGGHVQYLVSSDAQGGAGSEARRNRRAREDIVGDGKVGFATIRKGSQIEDYFRPGGRRTGQKRASVFLTYQMAESINLQSADALRNQELETVVSESGDHPPAAPSAQRRRSHRQ